MGRVEEEKENLRGCWEHIKKPCGLAGFTIQTRVRPQTDMAAQGWSMLLLAVKDKEAPTAVVLMATDSQLRRRDIEGSVITSPSKYIHNLDRKASKRTLKNCDKDVEV